MPDRFDSHEFILFWRKKIRSSILRPLYHYRDSNEPETPFMVVHGILARPVRYLLSNRARHLNEYPELIKHVGTEPSENIFGQVNACAEWKKASIITKNMLTKCTQSCILTP